MSLHPPEAVLTMVLFDCAVCGARCTPDTGSAATQRGRLCLPQKGSLDILRLIAITMDLILVDFSPRLPCY